MMPFLQLFGEQQNNDEKSIAKCNNVAILLSGIDADMRQIWELERGSDETKSLSEEEKGRELSSTENRDTSVSESAQFYNLMGHRLARIKHLIYNDKTTGSTEEDTKNCPPLLSSIVSEIVTSHVDLIPRLIFLLPSPQMPFESRKDIAAIFNALMIRRYIPYHSSQKSADINISPLSNGFADYVLRHYDLILSHIIRGHTITGSTDSALHCGSMLRSTLRHEALYSKLLLGSRTNSSEPSNCSYHYVYPILETFVHYPNFDVASDALATVRDILLTNRTIAAQFLEKEYSEVFSPKRYNKMLQSKNYITRRMSLKLLGEILLDRTNFGVMMKFISSAKNLAIIMVLLSDSSGNIQFEAFHVFKIFVANPSKPPEVIRVLSKNKVKLIKYLENFHSERESDDEQFRDEKRLVLGNLNELSS